MEIYCICRQPQDERFMIQCDKCDEWFHGDCVGVSEVDDTESFICLSCKTVQVVTETGKNPQKKQKRRKKLKASLEELNYWVASPKIQFVNSKAPLNLLKSLQHFGPANVMTLSHTGGMLAVGTTNGDIRIWSTKTWELLEEISDEDKGELEEIYVLKFTGDDRCLVFGGKKKSRHSWDFEDNDHRIMPCPLKMLDLETKKTVSWFGHTEEIFALKVVDFQGEIYYVTGSYDGIIMKWKHDYKSQIIDPVTSIVFSIAFLPNCGNAYLLAACDDKLKLFDFEEESLISTYHTEYGQYCTQVKFVNKEEFVTTGIHDSSTENKEDGDSNEKKTNKGKKNKNKKIDENTAILEQTSTKLGTDGGTLSNRDVGIIMKEESPITGNTDHSFELQRKPDILTNLAATSSTSLVQEQQQQQQQQQKPAFVHLRKLTLNESKMEFEMTTLRAFSCDPYDDTSILINRFLIRITSNGKYIFIPDCTGRVFIFNIKTGQLVGVLKDHKNGTVVRDVMLDYQRSLLYTCGDDGKVLVYSQP